MHSYIILKLQGPMQSWGGHTYEDYRPSGTFPTRSAIIGLLAACLGIDRQNKKEILQLAESIEIAVRQDEMNLAIGRLVDFHTIEKARKADGKENKNPIVSKREYLCDASFTLALRIISETSYSLNSIIKALQKPVYTPFLGRRSCPITRPLFETCVQADSFIQALRKIDPVNGIIYSDVDEESNGQIQIRDIPLKRHRQFATRRVYIHTTQGVVNVS